MSFPCKIKQKVSQNVYYSAFSKAANLRFSKQNLKASRGSAPWTPGGDLPLHPTRGPKAGPWTPPVMGFAPRRSTRAQICTTQCHWGPSSNFLRTPLIIIIKQVGERTLNYRSVKAWNIINYILMKKRIIMFVSRMGVSP